MPSQLLKQIRKELKSVCEPEKAAQMQAYMKSEMPYLGAQSPKVKDVCRRILKDFEFADRADFESQVRAMWDEAKYREERYCAINLSGVKSAKPYQVPAMLPLYEHMIVDGAWWDYVDQLAIHRVGPLLLEHPKTMSSKMLRWSKSRDIWKRRTAIICQISFKDETDLELLYECIEPSIESDEFFLRKGIGWALREVAWRNPKAVISYVKKNKSRLSGLSKREALKNVIKKGLLTAVP